MYVKVLKQIKWIEMSKFETNKIGVLKKLSLKYLKKNKIDISTPRLVQNVGNTKRIIDG
jgi:hypothetical protein